MSTNAHTSRMDTRLDFFAGVDSDAAGRVLGNHRCAGLGVFSGGEVREGLNRAAVAVAGEKSGAWWEVAAFAALEASALAGIAAALWV